MAIVHTNHKKAGAPNLRLTLPQPLDPVEEQLALLVVHKLVVEAVYRFLEGDSPKTLGLRYTGGGHEATPFVVQALGCCAAPPGPPLSNNGIIPYSRTDVNIFYTKYAEKVLYFRQ